MKLLIIQRIFSHYRKPIFDKIADITEFRLLHAANRSSIKQASSDYSKRVSSWQFGKKETNQFLWIFSQLVKFKPTVVIHEMALGMPTMFLTLWLRKFFGFKYVLWGHGYDRKIGFLPDYRFGDKLRLSTIKSADAVLLYDEKTKNLLGRYVNPNKLFVASNTLDTEKLISIRDTLERKGREVIREKLEWNRKYNLVYIGRLLDSKHPKKLFEVYHKLPKAFQKNVAIHIVGSGPEEKELRQMATTLSLNENFVFHGAVHDEFKTGEFLFAADLMIIPGAVGLSVNHAFAFDCPVATFLRTEEGPFHGPEIEYIIPYETGIVAPAFDSDLLANRMSEYLGSVGNQIVMRKQVRHLLESKATIGHMIQGFERVLEYTKS